VQLSERRLGLRFSRGKGARLPQGRVPATLRTPRPASAPRAALCRAAPQRSSRLALAPLPPTHAAVPNRARPPSSRAGLCRAPPSRDAPGAVPAADAHSPPHCPLHARQLARPPCPATCAPAARVLPPLRRHARAATPAPPTATAPCPAAGARDAPHPRRHARPLLCAPRRTRAATPVSLSLRRLRRHATPPRPPARRRERAQLDLQPDCARGSAPGVPVHTAHLGRGRRPLRRRVSGARSRAPRPRPCARSHARARARAPGRACGPRRRQRGPDATSFAAGRSQLRCRGAAAALPRHACGGAGRAAAARRGAGGCAAPT
jgi:hypothetical protein